jgi:hypothetical protein
MSVGLAIVRFTWRASFPRRRRWGLLLPCAGALLFGLLARTVDDTLAKGFAQVATFALFGLLLPIACLVIGDAVMGADIRAGTFPFTWLSPVPFRVIAIARWLAGTVVALVTVVPAITLAAFIAGVPEAAAPAALATAVAATAYVALFVFIGCATKRATVWSLGVILLGEHLAASTLDSVAQLSPGRLAFAVFSGLTDVPSDLVREGIPQGWSAVVRLGFVAVVCVGLAVWRLGRIKLSGAVD